MNQHPHRSQLIDAEQAAEPLYVETSVGAQALSALEGEWDTLFDSVAKPGQLFQSHAFLSAWVATYGDLYTTLYVITARQNGRLVGAAALAARKSFGLTSLQLMGAPVAQFGDILVDPASGRAVEAIWTAIEGIGADFLEVRRLREDAALWPVAAKDRYTFERMESPFACLSKRVDGDQPGAAYSSKDRSNNRRRLRRLAERGELALKAYSAGDEAIRLAEQAALMKADALKRDGVISPAVRSPRFAAFFKRVAANKKAGLQISTIELDGKMIGIDLSFLCKGTAFGHVLATDPGYDKEGVGILLVHHVFGVAKAAGARTFDLLAPADPYKLRHSDAATKVESRIYPFTAKGRFAAKLLYGHVLPLARRIVRWKTGLTIRQKAVASQANEQVE